jgi:hypothetical protein
MESDREMEEARQYLLTHTQPSKDEDYLGYQKYENALDKVRAYHNKKASPGAGDEVWDKFKPDRVQKMREDPQAWANFGHQIVLNSEKLTFTHEQLKDEAFKKKIEEGLAHNKHLINTMRRNTPTDVRGAASYLMNFTTDGKGDEHMAALSVYGDDKAMREIDDSVLSLEQMKAKGMLKKDSAKKIKSKSQITREDLSVTDDTHRQLFSDFSDRSIFAARIIQRSSDPAGVFKGMNYSLDENGNLVENKTYA